MESTQKRESRRRGNQRVDPRQKTQIQIQQISKLAGEWTVGRARSLLIKPGKERARKERKRQPRIGIRERGKSDTQSPALSPPPPSLRFAPLRSASLPFRRVNARRDGKQSKAKQTPFGNWNPRNAQDSTPPRRVALFLLLLLLLL